MKHDHEVQQPAAVADRQHAGFALFHVGACGGRRLAVARDEAGEARRIIAAEGWAQADLVIACVPKHGAQTSFLILPDYEMIAVEGDGFAGPAISFRLFRLPDASPALYELYHPLARWRRLGTVPDASGTGHARVYFDRVGDPATDHFALLPMAADALSENARLALQQLQRVVGPPLTAQRLMDALAAAELGPRLLESLMRLLPRDEFAALAERLMRTPADMALVRAAMPGDPWLEDALPALLAWRDGGRPATRHAVSPAAESHVAIPHSGELRPQAGLALTTSARRTIAPRRNAALLATAKDEGPYILDWIAHHRAIGFEHAVIYSNDNTDGSDALLALLARHGEITWVQNEIRPGLAPQVKAYGHAFKRLPDLLDYRWTMVLDLDEFVGLARDRFPTIHDYIAWQEHRPVDAVALPWLLFAAREADAWRPSSTPERFLRREASLSMVFKSLCRSNHFADSHAHFPYPIMDAPFSYRWENGDIIHHMAKLDGVHLPGPPATADQAWVAHYVLRTAPEALSKVVRGDGFYQPDDQAVRDRLDTAIERFLAMAAAPDLVTDRRMLEFAKPRAEEFARLCALPGVADCHASILARFADRLRLLVGAFLAVPVSDGDPPHYLAFRRVLESHCL